MLLRLANPRKFGEHPLGSLSPRYSLRLTPGRGFMRPLAAQLNLAEFGRYIRVLPARSGFVRGILRRHLTLTVVSLVVLHTLTLLASVEAQGPSAPAEPDEQATRNVEVRVWQLVADPLRIYISARPEGGSWDTLGTIPLPLDDGHSSTRNYRYGDVTIEGIEVRIWQRVGDALRVYISARPKDGSWDTLGTIPLPLDDGHSSGGTYRYGDITVAVPLPGSPRDETAADEEGQRDEAEEDPTRVCRWAETAARVVASTVKVSTPSATGSAFYVGGGQFVTAGHVVEDSPSRITLRNGHVSATARLVGFYAFDSGDVAILSASASGLTPLEWAGTLTIGSDIAIAGYPAALGETASWTRGTVSRLFTEGGISYLQTDAASNPGNSGGPLVDACGRVAGVVSFAYRDTEGLHVAVAEPTMSRKLIALGLRGYVVSPSGTSVDSEGTTSAGPQLDRYYGAVRIRVPVGNSYSYEPAPEGTVIGAIVGGEACGTDTTVTRYGEAQFSLTVEEGCGGAEPGVLVTFTVNGQPVVGSLYWGRSQEINLDVVPLEPEPTWDNIHTYLNGVLERWEEAQANISVTLANEREYYWRSGDGYGRGGVWQSLYPRRITWAGWVIQALTPSSSSPGPVALRSEVVESWRTAAHAYWTAYDTFLRKWAVNDAATDFYRERRDALWPAYRRAECELWQLQGYATSDDLCAEGQ